MGAREAKLMVRYPYGYVEGALWLAHYEVEPSTLSRQNRRPGITSAPLSAVDVYNVPLGIRFSGKVKRFGGKSRTTRSLTRLYFENVPFSPCRAGLVVFRLLHCISFCAPVCYSTLIRVLVFHTFK